MHVANICNNLHLETRKSRMGMTRLIFDTWCLILSRGSTKTQMSRYYHSNRQEEGFQADRKEHLKINVLYPKPCID